MKNFTLGACLLSAALSSSAFGTTIYLKADAKGTGTGENWANAYTTVADAIAALNAAGDGAELRIAQGVYSVTAGQTISIKNAVIRGGYRAAEDGDEVRDTLAYQTIIGGDTAATTQYWQKFDPVTETFTAIEPIEYIVKDGRMNLPDPSKAYDNAYDMWCWGKSNVGLYGAHHFTLAGENINVAGLCMTGARSKSNIYITGQGGIVDDCVFFANSPNSGSVQFVAMNGVVKSCRFIGNRSDGNATAVQFQNNAGKNCRMEDCYLEGNYVGASYGSALISVVASGAIVSNVVATRTFAKYAANTYHQSYGGVGCVFRDQAQHATVRNFVATNNLTRSTSDYASPIFLSRYTDVRDSYFANNRSEAHAVANICYSPFACGYNGSYDALWSNCVFRANEIRVTSCSAASGATYALAMLGNCKDGYKQMVYNCTFDSNLATILPDAEVEGVDVIRCRGVVHQAISADGGGVDVYKHLTFIGPKEEGVCDVAQFGGAQAKNMTISDSLFLLHDPQTVYDAPFYVTIPKFFKPTNCTIQNMTQQPFVDYTVTGLYSDPVPFAKEAVAGVPDAGLRPSAKTPGMLVTTDGGARGAMPLTDTAANGYTLTVRPSPLDGGTLSVPSTQAVLPGGQIVPITATPAEGSSFDGWYYEGGDEPFSPLETLSGLTLEDGDKTVIARFATRTVTIRLSLDGKCTFADTGLSTCVLKAHAGDDFPVPPEVRDSAEWKFVAWNFPAKVPGDADELEYVAYIITKGLRTIYLTPTGAGKKDGTSWDDAYGDFAAAYKDAGLYRGELRMAGGVYTISVGVEGLPNVTVIGGCDQKPTILNGDQTQDNTWTTNNVTVGRILQDGVIVRPSPVTDSEVWRHANVGVDSDYAIVPGPATVTNAAFRNVTFNGFKTLAVQFGAGAEVWFDKCSFVGCGTNNKGSGGTLYSAGTVHLKDTAFTGNYWALDLSGAGPETTNTIDGCVFDFNSSTYGGCSIFTETANTKPLVIANCRFERDCALGNQYYTCPAAVIRINGQNETILSNCVVTLCQSAGGSPAPVQSQSVYAKLVVDNCVFTNNVFRETGMRAVGYYLTDIPGSPCIGTLARDGTYVRNSYFARNRLDAELPSTPAWAYATAIGCGLDADLIIENCSFEDNIAIDASDSTADIRMGTIAGAAWENGGKRNPPRLAVVNCSFRSNSVSGAETAAEIIVRGGSDATTTTFTFLNDAAWNAARDYKPFAYWGDQPYVQISNCAFPNFDEGVFAEGDQYAFCTNVSTADPQFRDGVSELSGFAPQLKLAGASPFARFARKVWRKGEQLYYYDAENFPAKPWRLATNRKSVAASVDGLDFASPTHPDAFGAPRKSHPALGALNADPAGLMLMVR